MSTAGGVTAMDGQRVDAEPLPTGVARFQHQRVVELVGVVTGHRNRLPRVAACLVAQVFGLIELLRVG